jgi:hypothetical protein
MTMILCRPVKNGTGTESLKDLTDSSLSGLRILHLSDVGLPDWRIEKSAMSALKFDHEVMFAGGDSKNYQTKTFSKIYEINWTERARRGIPLYWYSVKKQVERVIKEDLMLYMHMIFFQQRSFQNLLCLLYMMNKEDDDMMNKGKKVFAYVKKCVAFGTGLHIILPVRSWKCPF